jgi:hypothetical protein
MGEFVARLVKALFLSVDPPHPVAELFRREADLEFELLTGGAGSRPGAAPREERLALAKPLQNLVEQGR